MSAGAQAALDIGELLSIPTQLIAHLVRTAKEARTLILIGQARTPCSCRRLAAGFGAVPNDRWARGFNVCTGCTCPLSTSSQ
jgi:hypothetical protein